MTGGSAGGRLDGGILGGGRDVEHGAADGLDEDDEAVAELAGAAAARRQSHHLRVGPERELSVFELVERLPIFENDELAEGLAADEEPDRSLCQFRVSDD